MSILNGPIGHLSRVDHLNGRTMIPNNGTSKVHSKYSFKAMSNKYKGNELVQADVRVDCYHSTVDLMSTTMCVDLDAQLLLF